MQNPKSFAIKKFMYDILKDKEFEDVIERISNSLITEKDLTSFSKLINKIYELGYLKAIAVYNEQLKKQGIKIN